MESKDDIIQIVVDAYFRLDKSARAVARELNIPRTTVRRKLKEAKNDIRYKGLFGIAESCDINDERILTHKVNELKRELNNANKKVINSEYIKKFVFGFKNAQPEFPEWLRKKEFITTKETGVPQLILSDWHYGEVIDPAQIFGVNEYNIEIANARAMEVVDKAIDLAFNHIANPVYPGIIVSMLGDMISGNIHDELKITGEKEVLQTVLDLVGILTKCLTRLADAFGKVFVPCVAGNHGRLSIKPRAKNMAFDNLDWLAFQMLSRVLEKDKRIKFLIPDGEDAQYKVYDWTYRITHGSQFKGGNAIAGSVVPLIHGDIKKRTSARSMGIEYDTLIIGHFHQYMSIADRCICNGSLSGYSEFAAKCNFPFEKPKQAFFITNEQHGITFNMPIQIESERREEKQWISWEE